jgi:CRP-like cAMP-binding protein
MFYTEHQYPEQSDTARQTVAVLSNRPALGDSQAHAIGANRLLAVLPALAMERIEGHLDFVALGAGDVLYQSGSHMRHVYFPTTSIVSLLHTMANGASAEIALVGNEGVAGASLCMGDETTACRAVVSSAGGAYRLASKVIKQEFARGETMQQLLLRYSQALITQMGQTAACNRHHALEQQLCRRLLLSLDRISSNEFALTHQTIADMLGVRRESVTETAGKLQSAGLIRYTRGRITILDRGALEARTCECYAAVKRENDRLLRNSTIS